MTHSRRIQPARTARALVVGAIPFASLFIGVSPLVAQSLGELARQEAVRRSSLPKSSPVYTNDTLPSMPPPAVPAGSPRPPVVPPSPAPTETPAAAADALERSAKGEAHWRERLDAERAALDRAGVLVDALHSRVNGLQTDFVNRDDPAARALIARERERALTELDRTRREIEQRSKALADLQEEARRAGVPAQWYR